MRGWGVKRGEERVGGEKKESRDRQWGEERRGRCEERKEKERRRKETNKEKKGSMKEGGKRLHDATTHDMTPHNTHDMTSYHTTHTVNITTHHSLVWVFVLSALQRVLVLHHQSWFQISPHLLGEISACIYIIVLMLLLWCHCYEGVMLLWSSCDY